MVASDNCKISKALPSAMGLRMRQPDGLHAQERVFKGRKKLLSEWKRYRRDWREWQPKHKVYRVQWKGGQPFGWVNPCSRKALGDEDKAMGSQPIRLRMPKERHHGRFRDCLRGQTNPVLNLLPLRTTLGFHIHKTLIITVLILKNIL